MNEENTKQINPPGAEVLAINVCDTIIRDEITHKVSLIGLFSNIWAGSFPCVHERMHIYIALTGGHAKHKMDVRLVRASDERTVVGMQGPLEFKNPLHVVEVNLQWKKVTFEQAGTYRVEVLCDGKMIGSRKFKVGQQGQSSPPTDGSEVV